MASVATRLPPAFPSAVTNGIFQLSPTDRTSTTCRDYKIKTARSEFPWLELPSTSSRLDVSPTGSDGVGVKISEDVKIVDDTGLSELVLVKAFDFRLVDELRRDIVNLNEEINDFRDKLRLQVKGVMKKAETLQGATPCHNQLKSCAEERCCREYVESTPIDKSAMGVWLERGGKDETKVEIVEQQVSSPSRRQKSRPGSPRLCSPRSDNSQQASPDFLSAERPSCQRNHDSKSTHESENVMTSILEDVAWETPQRSEDSKNLSRLSSSSEDENLDSKQQKVQNCQGQSAVSGACKESPENQQPKQLNLLKTFDLLDNEDRASKMQCKNDQNLPFSVTSDEKDDSDIIPPPSGYRGAENGSKSAGKKSTSPRSLKLLGEEKRAFLRDCMSRAARILSQKCRQKYKPLESNADSHPHTSAPTTDTDNRTLRHLEQPNVFEPDRFGSTFVYEESIPTYSDSHDDCNRKVSEERLVQGSIEKTNGPQFQRNYQAVHAQTCNEPTSRPMRNTQTGSSTEYTQSEGLSKMQASTTQMQADSSRKDILTGTGEKVVQEVSQSRSHGDHATECQLSASTRQDHGGVTHGDQRPCCMYGYMMSNPSLQPSFLLHPPGFLSLWTQQTLNHPEVSGTLVPPVTRFVHVSDRMKDLMGLGGREKATTAGEPNLEKHTVPERSRTGSVTRSPTLSRDSKRSSFRLLREPQTSDTQKKHVAFVEGSRQESDIRTNLSKADVHGQSVDTAKLSNHEENRSERERIDCSNGGYSQSGSNHLHVLPHDISAPRAVSAAADDRGTNARIQEAPRESTPSPATCMTVPCWETYISALPIVGCPFVAPTYQRMSFLPVGEQHCPTSHAMVEKPSGQHTYDQGKSSEKTDVPRQSLRESRPPSTGILISNNSSTETSRIPSKPARLQQQESEQVFANTRQIPDIKDIQKSAEIFEEIRKKTSHDDSFPPRRPCLLPRDSRQTSRSEQPTPALQSMSAGPPEAVGRSRSLKLALQLSRAASMAGLGGRVDNIMGHCVRSLDPKRFLMNTIVKILNNFEEESSTPHSQSKKRLESPVSGKGRDGSRILPDGSGTWTEVAEKSVERHFVVETLKLALEDGFTPELPLESCAPIREDVISSKLPFTHSAHAQPSVHFNTRNLRLVTSDPVFETAAMTYDRKLGEGHNDPEAGDQQGFPPTIAEGVGRERWNRIRRKTRKYMSADPDHSATFPERSAMGSRTSDVIPPSNDVILTNGDRPLASAPTRDSLKSFRDRSPLCRLSPPSSRYRASSRENQPSPRKEVSPRSRVVESDSLRRAAIDNIRRSRDSDRGGNLSRSASFRMHMGTRDMRQSVQFSSFRDQDAARGRFRRSTGNEEPDKIDEIIKRRFSGNCEIFDNGEEHQRKKETTFRSQKEECEDNQPQHEDTLLQPLRENIGRHDVVASVSVTSAAHLPSRSSLPENCGQGQYSRGAPSVKTNSNVQTKKNSIQVEPATKDEDGLKAMPDGRGATDSCTSSTSISSDAPPKSSSKRDRSKSRSKVGSRSLKSTRSRSCFEAGSGSSDDWDSASSVSLCFSSTSSSSSNCDLTNVSDLDMPSRSSIPISSEVPVGFSV